LQVIHPLMNTWYTAVPEYYHGTDSDGSNGAIAMVVTVIIQKYRLRQIRREDGSVFSL